MRTLLPSFVQGRRTTGPRRAALLQAFDRSGLSAAAFARQYHLNYTTFCGWRHKRAKANPIPPSKRPGKAKPRLHFRQVELDGSLAPAMAANSSSSGT
jgi:hypothetical protein